MQNSIWKLTALAGVVGLGFLVVLQAQRGLTRSDSLSETGESQQSSETADSQDAAAASDNSTASLGEGTQEPFATGEPEQAPAFLDRQREPTSGAGNRKSASTAASSAPRTTQRSSTAGSEPAPEGTTAQADPFAPQNDPRSAASKRPAASQPAGLDFRDEGSSVSAGAGSAPAFPPETDNGIRQAGHREPGSASDAGKPVRGTTHADPDPFAVGVSKPKTADIDTSATDDNTPDAATPPSKPAGAADGSDEPIPFADSEQTASGSLPSQSEPQTAASEPEQPGETTEQTEQQDAPARFPALPTGPAFGGPDTSAKEPPVSEEKADTPEDETTEGKDATPTAETPEPAAEFAPDESTDDSSPSDGAAPPSDSSTGQAESPEKASGEKHPLAPPADKADDMQESASPVPRVEADPFPESRGAGPDKASDSMPEMKEETPSSTPPDPQSAEPAEEPEKGKPDEVDVDRAGESSSTASAPSKDASGQDQKAFAPLHRPGEDAPEKEPQPNDRSIESLLEPASGPAQTPQPDAPGDAPPGGRSTPEKAGSVDESVQDDTPEQKPASSHPGVQEFPTDNDEPSAEPDEKVAEDEAESSMEKDSTEKTPASGKSPKSEKGQADKDQTGEPATSSSPPERNDSDDGPSLPAREAPQRLEPSPEARQVGPAEQKPKDAVAGGETSGRGTARGMQRPELKIEKTAPPHAVLGQPMVYTIHVKNVGRSPAYQVVVEDRIPQGTKLTGTIPQARLQGQRLVWKLGRLQPGRERKIRVRVIPQSEGEIGSVATVNFVSEIESRTKITAPKLQLELDAPRRARVGETVTVTFKLTNNGRAPATGVVIRDVFSEALQHPGGNDLEYEVGTLPAGASREISLPLKAASPGENVVNKATVSADDGLNAERKVNLTIVGPSSTESQQDTGAE